MIGTTNLTEWARLLGSGAAGSAIGGALAALGKGFWVRWIEERTLSTEQLLERLERGTLTRYGRRRLEGEGLEMIALWRRALLVPSRGPKLRGWPSAQPSFHIRSFSDAEGDSACPLLRNEIPPLFLNLPGENAHDLIAELRAELDRLNNAYRSSKALIPLLHFTDKEAQAVWISALGVTIRERSMIDNLLERITAEIKKVLPTAPVARL
jgi:hypothetical protein